QERQHAGAQGQDQGVPRQFRFAVGCETRDRDPRRGPPHRRHHRTIRRHSDDIENIQPHDPGPAPAGDGGSFEPLQGQAGHNNTGRITVRFRGGGHKKAYRAVDFKRAKIDVPAVVERLEYDPNRTAFIALIKYQDGEQAYILAPQRLAAGDTVVAGNYVDVKPGNVMPLGNMPIGTIVHNVEMKIGKGGQLARSAGTYAQLVGRDHDYVILRLNSGE